MNSLTLLKHLQWAKEAVLHEQAAAGLAVSTGGNAGVGCGV